MKKKLSGQSKSGRYKQNTRKTLYEKQKGLCYYCKFSIHLEGNTQHLRFATRDHRIPLSKGGTDNVENIVLACKLCNESKDNLTEEEFLVKLRLGTGWRF